MPASERDSKVLIIGKVPPPIGGFTIHVQRLLQSFYKDDILIFYNLANYSIWSLFKSFWSYKIIHLHTSNPALRFYLAFSSVIFKKKLIITFHGNIGRFGIVGNIFDLLSVSMCSKPILLNKGSYNKAKKYNPNSELLSSFIPPFEINSLPEKFLNEIKRIKTEDVFIYCTNAYDVSFDNKGNEIYGISELLESFSGLSRSKLIVSDPSGNYKKFIKKKYEKFIDVPLWISEAHDFFEVLKLSNGLIRNTITDGDSISVKEALFLKLPVYATTVVDRPYGCILYDNQEDLIDQIILFQKKGYQVDEAVESSIKRLESIYTSYLS